MRLRNKKIKYIILFAIMLGILCIGQKVKALTYTELYGGTDVLLHHSYGAYPENESFANAPYYLLCAEHSVPWTYRGEDPLWLTSDEGKLWLHYDRKEDRLVEASAGFGMYTAALRKEENVHVLQHLFWASAYYKDCTGFAGSCLDGGGTKYESYYGEGVSFERAHQYASFYYGILDGGTKKIDLTLDESKSKVFIDQANDKIVLGPYRIKKPKLYNTSYIFDAAEALRDELAGDNYRRFRRPVHLVSLKWILKK